MKHLLPMIAALVVLVCSAVAFDRMTHRWTASRDLEAAARRLDDLPTELPGWTSETVEMDPDQLQAAEAVNAYSRKFTERGPGGASVHVTILCGAFGPISVHPPTVCFTGVGMTQLDRTTPAAVDAVEGERLAELHRTTFRGTAASGGQRLRTYWGWGIDGDWAAVEQPRLTFAGRPYLYKAYVLVDDRLQPDADGLLPEQRFLREFLPRVRKALTVREEVE